MKINNDYIVSLIENHDPEMDLNTDAEAVYDTVLFFQLNDVKIYIDYDLSGLEATDNSSCREVFSTIKYLQRHIPELSTIEEPTTRDVWTSIQKYSIVEFDTEYSSYVDWKISTEIPTLLSTFNAVHEDKDNLLKLRPDFKSVFDTSVITGVYTNIQTNIKFYISSPSDRKNSYTVSLHDDYVWIKLPKDKDDNLERLKIIERLVSRNNLYLVVGCNEYRTQPSEQNLIPENLDLLRQDLESMMKHCVSMKYNMFLDAMVGHSLSISL